MVLNHMAAPSTARHDFTGASGLCPGRVLPCCTPPWSAARSAGLLASQEQGQDQSQHSSWLPSWLQPGCAAQQACAWPLPRSFPVLVGTCARLGVGRWDQGSRATLWLKQAPVCAAQGERDAGKGLEMRKLVLSGFLASEEIYINQLEALLLVSTDPRLCSRDVL